MKRTLLQCIEVYWYEGVVTPPTFYSVSTTFAVHILQYFAKFCIFCTEMTDPLLEAVIDLTNERNIDVMKRGSIFIDESDFSQEARLLFYIEDPVLRWMAGNVVIETDAAENIKVTKAKSKEKIDGIVASIMALDRCLRNQGEPQGSVYDERGLLIL